MTKKLDLLDSSAIDDSRADQTFKNGYVFSLLLRFLIGIFGIIGILAIYYGEAGYVIGPILLLIASFGLTYQHGTDISFENSYIRPYTKIWGIKRGKWISTISYPDLAFLKMGTSTGLKDIKRRTSEQDNNHYDLYLFSGNHRKRLYITSFKGLTKTEEVAKELADLIDKNFTTFQPRISKNTLAKRYERHY
jgi:hypothetical protein